jgi:hypothetical protein
MGLHGNMTAGILISLLIFLRFLNSGWQTLKNLGHWKRLYWGRLSEILCQFNELISPFSKGVFVNEQVVVEGAQDPILT